MDPENFMEPEVGIAIAITAAVASPKVRKVVRRGAVYGLAGLLKVKDMVSQAAHSVAETARGAVAGLRSEAPAEGEGAHARKRSRATA